jgi:large subunit ribosomal protein LX
MIMAEQKYEVTGTFKPGGEWHPYTKVITAPNENRAKERIYAELGSKHRLKRNLIIINGVTLINGE